MAGSRRSPPADADGKGGAVDGDGARPLHAALARTLREAQVGDRRVLVALSGGRDSVALLHALVGLTAHAPDRVVAAHVHHGLSIYADEWTAFCAGLCDALRVRLVTQRVQVERGPRISVEAAARDARYRALAAMARANDAALVLLAHHADDQAETLLLQLVRGAGPRGLAGMAPLQARDGANFARPWLDVPRSGIDAYVVQHGLRHVADDSNADVRWRRNALRQRVVPGLRECAPGYPATLVRAAAHQADAARLLDELAALDAGALDAGTVHAATLDAATLDAATLDPHVNRRATVTLSRERLAALPAHRARNVLRWFLHAQGLRPPGTARLRAMLEQLTGAAPDARVRLVHDGREIGLARGRILVHASPPPAFDRAWRGEDELILPHGTLQLVADAQGGLDRARLFAQPVEVRSRRGGERFCAGAGRPARALKHLLQEANIPVWERNALPLVFAGDALAAVPGIGIDPAFLAAPGRAGWRLHWQARVADLPNAQRIG
jgi:tRNA(Ile)-lysidine synthase